MRSTISITAAPPATAEDIDRARHAALASLEESGIDPVAAYLAWRTDPDAAEAWLRAENAASIALTATWADPAYEAEFSMTAW